MAFKWFNEAKKVAQVHCVIVGFYCGRKKAGLTNGLDACGMWSYEE